MCKRRKHHKYTLINYIHLIWRHISATFSETRGRFAGDVSTADEDDEDDEDDDDDDDDEEGKFSSSISVSIV